MLDSPYMQHVVRSGFVNAETVVHLFVGGSELHGSKVGATDDLDLYGVFLDGPAEVLGLRRDGILSGRRRVMTGGTGPRMWT